MNDFSNAFDTENLNNVVNSSRAPSTQPVNSGGPIESYDFRVEDVAWSTDATSTGAPPQPQLPSNGIAHFNFNHPERTHLDVPDWFKLRLRRVSYSAESFQQYTATNPIPDCPPLHSLPYPVTRAESHFTPQTAQTTQNNTFSPFSHFAQHADNVEYNAHQHRYVPYPQRHYSNFEIGYPAFPSAVQPQQPDLYHNRTTFPQSSVPAWNLQSNATFSLSPSSSPQDHMTTNRCAAVVTTKSKGKARAEPLPSSAPSLPLPAPPCAANKDSQTGPIRSKGKKGTRKYITIDAFTPVVLDMEADPRGMTGICQWLVDDNHICGEHYNMNFVCDHVRISHLKPTVPESEWDPESPTFRFKCRWHRCKHAGKELKLCSLKNHFLKHRPPKLCQWCLRVFDRQHLLKDHTKECERNPKNVASGSK